ncbi:MULTISPECIES: hypothetical protein [Mesobacillus]|uniref:hypothetical protein n=1 Tax=Mesobacillus TaxID=2675231 RepID=UPI001782521D|nr:MULTISPECIES: hypothetical protein [Mesobacillus]MCM3574079.1 hypothetical protein [Mesobacillus subterraneus]UYZ21580.1 hypothetical protein FOF60_21655 [Mesobacillus jeotgali]
MQFVLGLNIAELFPTVAAYSILSLMAIGVIYLFKKKSDKELKELEEKMGSKDTLK